VTNDKFDIADAILERRLEEARALGLASDGLANKAPHLSARTGLSAGQRSGGWSLLGALLVFTVMAPGALAIDGAVLASCVFTALIVMRLAAALNALTRRRSAPPQIASNNDLPVITYLVALKDEARVVASLIKAIDAIDYPAHLLDVKLLVEADDFATLGALRKLTLPQGFEIMPVPPGAPRTKPRALNYGLASARGDIVAVLDAEDRPSPDQARQAVAAFTAGGRDLAVVQAPLLAHNGGDSWIARQFDAEYNIHFLVWLPFLARLGAPLPLGGTSNYFRRDRLEAAGGWDAWNVTEDADLGLRLARMGWRAAVIDAPTYEEAPIRFGHWFNQRTRWIKGHIQTWLVLMRDPIGAANGMGWPQFLITQLTFGGSLLASFLHGWIIIVAAAMAALGAPILIWAVALLAMGYVSVMLAALVARRRPSISALATLPLYWPLLSIAAVKALWEQKRRPHYWAKTPHGLSPAGPPDPQDGAEPISLNDAAAARARAKRQQVRQARKLGG
jgi:cellulose synthase/poly-beta-1,6-N-acetylglucosamine synthase-like glycosyltransferase